MKDGVDGQMELWAAVIADIDPRRRDGPARGTWCAATTVTIAGATSWR